MQQPNVDTGGPGDRAPSRRRRPHPARQARLVAGVASASAMVGLVLGLANRAQPASAQTSTVPSSATSSSPSTAAATSPTGPTTTQGRSGDGERSRSWSDDEYPWADDGSGGYVYGGSVAGSGSSSATPTSPPPTAVAPTVPVTPRSHTSSHGS